MRIWVKIGGCAGMAYKMEYAESVEPDRRGVVEGKCVRHLVGPKAALFLLGTETDLHVDKLAAQFVFNTPTKPWPAARESVARTPEFRVDLANDPVAAVVLGGVDARVDSLDSITGRARPMGSLPPRPRLSCGRDSRRSAFHQFLADCRAADMSATVSPWRKPVIGRITADSSPPARP